VTAAVLAMLLYKVGNPQHQLKIGIGIVAIIIFVCAAVRPLFALGLVIALLPFEFYVYGIGTDEALIFGVGAVLMWRIDFRTIPWWISVGGVAILFGSLFSLLVAHSQGQAAWGGVRWLGLLVLAAEAFSLLRNQPDAGRRFVNIVCGAGVVVVVFALAQKAGIYAIVGAPFQPGNIQSFFNYYTNYGGYVAMVAVLATGETLAATVSGERTRAAIFGGCTVFMVLGVAISASRGALLALAVSWVVLVLLISRRANVLVRLVGILALLVAAGFVATPAQTRVRIQTRFSTPLGSQYEDIQRFGLQKLGEHTLAHSPLGIGFNNFRYLSAAHPTPDVSGTVFDHAHRTVVQIGLDAGWLGLAGYLLLVVGAFIVAIRIGPKRGVRNLTCVAALAGAMAQGLNDYLYFDLSLMAFFLALVWGSVWVPSPAADGPVTDSRRCDRVAPPGVHS
jgi:O-antigen ligase